MNPPARRGFVAIAAVLFAFTFLYRILDPTFHNDHFEHLALATEMLHGAIPGVDFFDPSRPLQYSLTAVGLLFGHQLLAEALIAITCLSAGSVLMFALGTRLTGAKRFGVFAAVIVIAALPRLYSYPKIIVPAMALLAWCRYAERPSRGLLAVVGLATVVGFYFRFDYLAWLGIAMTAGLVVQHWGHPRVFVSSLLAYGAIAAVLCAPYGLFQVAAGGVLSSGPSTGRLTRVIHGEDVVAFDALTLPHDGPWFSLRPAGPLTNVRWTHGLSGDMRARLEQQYGLSAVRTLDDDGWQYVMSDQSPATLSRLMTDPSVAGVTNIDPEGRVLREPPWVMVRRWLHVPMIESPLLTRDNGTVWLYDVLFFTPFAAALLFLLARPASAGPETSTIVVAIVLSVLFNIFLIRGNTDSRLPDILVPNVLLWAWMWRTLLRQVPGMLTILATTAVAWSLLVAVDLYSDSLDHLGSTQLLSTPITTARQLKWAITGLAHPLDRLSPGTPGVEVLVRYIRRCTAPDDRLLVLGYQPEFFFFSDRRMAGGNPVYQSNLGAAPGQQRTIVARLERQRVPVVLLPMNRLADIESTYPIVKQYVDRRYVIAKESGFGDARTFRVLVDPHLMPHHVDTELQLPCYTASAEPASPG